MSELVLTTQQTAALEKRVEQFKKNFKAGWAGMRRAGAQMIGYRVSLGNMLNQAKELFPHGEFEKWVREEIGLPDSTQNDYRTFAAAFLEEMKGLDKSPTVGLLGKGSKSAIDTIMNIAPKVMQGRNAKELVEDYRVLKLIAQAEEADPGGYRPNKAKLKEWLTEHYPDLDRKQYDELPKKVQREFAKFDLNSRNEPDLEKQAQEQKQAWIDFNVTALAGDWFAVLPAADREACLAVAEKITEKLRGLKATKSGRLSEASLPRKEGEPRL